MASKARRGVPAYPRGVDGKSLATRVLGKSLATRNRHELPRMPGLFRAPTK
jgi:hypothetical protein